MTTPVYLYPLKPINSFALEAECRAAAPPVPVKGNGVSADAENVRVACLRDCTPEEKAALDLTVANHVPPPSPVGGGNYVRAHADAGGTQGEQVMILPAGSVQFGLSGTYVLHGRGGDVVGGSLPLTKPGQKNGLAGGWDIQVLADGTANLWRAAGTDLMDANLSLIWL